MFQSSRYEYMFHIYYMMMIICRLEAEQKRQAELEKQRQQQLEMEREQEALRKQMIQQRLVRHYVFVSRTLYSPGAGCTKAE